jgi:hypothetical protein
VVINVRAGRGYLNEKINNYNIPNAVNYTCSTGQPGSCESGFNLFPSGNFLTNKDISIRKTFEADVSYYVSNLFGRHAFKFGYQLNKLFNDDNEGFVDTGVLDFAFGQTSNDKAGRERGFGIDPGALGVGS